MLLELFNACLLAYSNRIKKSVQMGFLSHQNFSSIALGYCLWESLAKFFFQLEAWCENHILFLRDQNQIKLWQLFQERQRFDSTVVREFLSYNNAVKFNKIQDVIVCWKLRNLLQVFMWLAWSCLEDAFGVN